MDEDCIFCKIVRKEVPADVMYEDEEFLAFKDIKPSAPTHLLVIPKQHIASLDHFGVEDKELMGKLLYTIQKVARMNNLKGYRIIMNVGREGGQVIDHAHFHLQAGYAI